MLHQIKRDSRFFVSHFLLIFFYSHWSNLRPLHSLYHIKLPPRVPTLHPLAARVHTPSRLFTPLPLYTPSATPPRLNPQFIASPPSPCLHPALATPRLHPRTPSAYTPSAHPLHAPPPLTPYTHPSPLPCTNRPSVHPPVYAIPLQPPFVYNPLAAL